MTVAYELERLRVALEAVESAATELAKRELPDWLSHRIAHIRVEAKSMKACMDELKEGESR